MQPQIITVHDIEASIKDVGIRPYANTLVQELGSGSYFYVEAEIEKDDSTISHGWSEHLEIFEHDYDDFEKEEPQVSIRWRYRIVPVPTRLAWMVIDAMRIKAECTHMGDNEYERTHGVAVYLVPGSEIMGQKVEKLTEIPAEVRPVILERL